jgi:large subunit ribosomal protein L9
MEVIIKKQFETLGDQDDLVVVKDGYARNYLIPQGIAVIATPAAKKVREENLRQRAHKIAKQKTDAKALLEKLMATTIEVGAKVGESGKIFGSVTSLQLSDALKKQGFDVERKHIHIQQDAIKQVGSYMAKVKLQKDLEAEISFTVVGE